MYWFPRAPPLRRWRSYVLACGLVVDQISIWSFDRVALAIATMTQERHLRGDHGPLGVRQMATLRVVGAHAFWVQVEAPVSRAVRLALQRREAEDSDMRFISCRLKHPLAFIAVSASVVLAGCTSAPPPASAVATVTVTASPTAGSNSTPLDATPSPTEGDSLAPPSAPTDLTVTPIGTPVLVEDPTGAGAANLTVNSITRRAPDPKAYGFVQPKYGTELVVNLTVRATKGQMDTYGLRFSLRPDADTGTPQYEHELGVVGMGDRDLYGGKVPAGKHVTGETYFDVPPGAYTLVVNVGTIYTGMFDVASWRYVPAK